MLTGVPERMLCLQAPYLPSQIHIHTMHQRTNAKERMIIDRPQSQTVIGDLTSDPDTILFIFLNAL